MAQERIILSVEFDDVSAKKRVVELEKEITAAKQANKDLAESFKTGVISQDKYNKALLESNRAIKAMSTEQSNLNRNIALAERINSSAAGSLNQIKAEIILLTSAYDKLSKEERENEKIGGDLQKRIRGLSDTLKEFKSSIGDNRTNVGNYGNSITAMKDKIVELDKVIQTTDVGTKEFKEAKAEADNLKLSIQQALGEVDEFGDREPKNPLKKANEDMIETLGSVAVATQLSTVLFGENEDAMAAIETSTKAIAVAQSVKQLVQAKGAILDTAELILTKAKTAATAAYTFVVGTSTGAMKAFRIALAASGIGLLVIGLLAAAEAMGAFGDDTADATDKINKQREAQAKLNEDLQKQVEAMNLNRKASLDAISNEISQLKAKGATDKEIYDKELELINKRIQAKKAEAFTFDEETEQRKKALQDLANLESESYVLLLSFEKKKKDDAEKAKKEADDAAKEKKKKDEQIAKEYAEYLARDADARREGMAAELAYEAELKQKAFDKAFADLKSEYDKEKRYKDEAFQDSIKESVQNEEEFSLAIAQARLEGVMSEYELQNLQLNNDLYFFQSQRDALEKHGDNLTQIDKAIADKRQEIRVNDKQNAEQIEQAKFQIATSGIDAIGSLLKLGAQNASQAAEFQKAIALFQIGIDTAKAISGVIRAASDSSLSVYDFAAQVALGVATVLANIAQAKQLLTESAEVPKPQFYEGGYTTPGNPTEEANNLGEKDYTYHKNEYVIPHAVLATPQGSTLAMLAEAVRKTVRGNPSMPGMYNGGLADGGLTARSITGQGFDPSVISDAVAKGMAKVEIYTSHTEFERFAKSRNANVAKSKL